MDFNAFRHALPILERLEKNGFQAYFVGGSVRDALIDREVGDIDITTSAKPEEVQNLFEKVIPVGIEHGTVIVRWEGESYEVTTFRSETGYSDYRHPDEVMFVDEVKKDLERRDFTINAIALNNHGEIIDPFDGMKDIKAKVIKAVGNPKERFAEDPLRMMRAVRFVSQLNFDIEPLTKAAIHQCSSLLKKVSIERVAIEAQKLFAGKSPGNGLEILLETELNQSIPVWKEEAEVIERIKKVIIPLYSMEEILAFFLLKGVDISLSDWIREWKLSNRIKNNTEKLLEAYRIYQEEGLSNWLIYNIPAELQESFVRLIYAFEKKEVDKELWKKTTDNLPIKTREELAVKGDDIIEMFPELPRGKWIKEILTNIEYLVVSGKLNNDKKKIKEWVRDGEHPQTSD